MEEVKVNKERISEIVEKINDSNEQIFWENGEPKFKKKSEIKKGKLSRARGARFELFVRKDLESKGKTVDKWSNNVDLIEKKLAIAKRKYNPFSKVMTLGTGFPDFITLSHVHDGLYSVIGVEVKINGILSKEEKEKCAWYLDNGIFSGIWIASQKKNGRKTEVDYVDFKERYSKK
ncbi:MAG: hypothetical protein Q8Q04_03545 [archaeon]|nr:hypothetical protein [archaeon]